jgi:hypothetical protein
MKKTAFWVLKHLLIPVGFIWATGLFNLIHRVDHSTKSLAYDSFDSSEYKTLEMNPSTIVAYGDSLLKARKLQIGLTGFYKPDHFFHDLKQFKMFEKLYYDSLNQTPEGRCLYMRCVSNGGCSYLSDLVGLRDGNWRKNSILQQKGTLSIAEARSKWFPSEAIAEKQNDVYWSKFKFTNDVLLPLCGWLLKVYLKGLPFAFLMLIVWRYRLKHQDYDDYWSIEDRNRFLKSRFSPLSFIFSLLLWPIVLVIDIRNRTNLLLRKTDVLSRREKLMTLFSQKELELLEIGKKMTKSEFKAYLQSIGYVRRHSFAKTLLFIVFLEVAVPYAHAIDMTARRSCKHEYSLVIKQIPKCDCDIGIPILSPPQIIKKFVEQKEKASFYLRRIIGRILSGFTRRVLSVPRLGTLSIT